MKRLGVDLVAIIGLGLSIGSVVSFMISLIAYGENMKTTFTVFFYSISVYVGIILVAVIFDIIALILSWEGEKKRSSFQKVSLISGITLLILGIHAVISIDWLIGGIIGYLSLILLSVSKSRLESISALGAFLLLLGFLILILVPSTAAYFSVAYNELSSITYIIFIVVGMIISVFGLSLIVATRTHISRMIGSFVGISSTTFSLLVVPAHEYIQINSNMIYGVYDTSLLYFSILMFWIYTGVFIYELYRERTIGKNLAKGYDCLFSIDIDKAEEYFLKAIRTDDSCTEALVGLGLTYALLGKYEEAVKYLKKAAELRPSENIYVNLGNAYFASGKIEDAEKMYKEALNLNEKYFPAIINIARLYVETGKFDEAEKYIKMARENDPSKKSVDVIEAIYYEKTSNKEKLSEIFDKLKNSIGSEVISLEVISGA